jgi:hypothetical protein
MDTKSGVQSEHDVRRTRIGAVSICPIRFWKNLALQATLLCQLFPGSRILIRQAG